MITEQEPTAADERRSRILIPDTSPLSLLAMIGSDALDWLFVPNADIWIPDMVKAEATRAPDPGDDPRHEHRATLTEWFQRNANRIHIVEEARHIGFARAELVRTAAAVPRWELPYHRLLLAHIAYIVCRSLVNPAVYAAVGLDPRATRKVAVNNPYHRESIRYGGEKIMPFLAEAGLVGAPGMYFWRESFLIG